MASLRQIGNLGQLLPYGLGSGSALRAEGDIPGRAVLRGIMRDDMRKTAFVLLALAGAGVADDRAARTDDIFSALAGTRSPGAAVLVRQDGRTVFARGYGVAELRHFRPIDAATDFRLASCTKQFTAMAIMLLVHDGKLKFESRLTEIFPEFPAYGRAVTIRHLLSHTAGLPDYEDLMDQAGKKWTATDQIQDAEVLQLLEREPRPKFAAGEGWSYSNSAYVVLGLIVAKVSGEPFPRFLERRIFGPLKMRGTLAYVKGGAEPPNRAFGHSKRGGELIETDQSSTSATLGDGGVYSNLDDLAKWDQTLAAHSLLSEDEMRPAWTPARLASGAEPHWPAAPGGDNLAPGKPVSYGFGWFLDPYTGRSRTWHTGTTMGFRNAIERFTKDKITVVVLSNRADQDANALTLRAAEVWLPPR
ncbi:MAG TPA: serine hydrolase domain-containing protein [Bryobacteraceae bacterium]|jgi:CubicO group peptidase (beta-lactamase class C family)